MDKVAIMEKKDVGKRAKVVKRCNACHRKGAIDSSSSSLPSSSSESSSRALKSANIHSLPVELILEIFSYLSQLDLRNMARVSAYFKSIARDPVFRRTYEVTYTSTNTSTIIERLRKMTFLRKLRIYRRQDSDEILKQIPLTNKYLENLGVYNCTDSTPKYLRSLYLTRILKKCRRLHTIEIFGSPLCGRKFYKLLGEIVSRFKHVSVPMSNSQYLTFVEHVTIEKKNRLKKYQRSDISYILWRKHFLLSHTINNKKFFRFVT